MLILNDTSKEVCKIFGIGFYNHENIKADGKYCHGKVAVSTWKLNPIIRNAPLFFL